MRICNLCGSTHKVTQHHVGGKNLIAWFTMSLCDRCQVIFHAKQRAAGIDLRCATSPLKRLVRALKMTFLFGWVLVDMLEAQIDQEIEQTGAIRGESPDGK